jgi:tRNA threonylcarbamoyladenosine modification (KEOPS) complex Cgi121 subunit
VPPLPAPEKRPIWAVGARRAESGRPTAAELVRHLRAAAKPDGPLLALLDARGVAGERHLLSAWAHLGRARQRGEARLRDRGAEFLLFVAGDDQLPRALGKVGIQPDTEEFVLVAEPSDTPEARLGAWGLVADPSVYPRPVTPALLARLGIDEADRSALPASAWEGLVLERVALLELSAPKAAAPPGAKGGRSARRSEDS